MITEPTLTDEKAGRPRMGKERRIAIHPIVDPNDARQLKSWSGLSPLGHCVGWLVRHARKTGFRPKDYAK